MNTLPSQNIPQHDMNTGDAMAEEPGVWSTSVPNRSPSLIIISIVFVIITTFFFTFRQGWRWAHKQRGWDDMMAAFAYILLVIQTVFGGIAAHYGFGKHVKQIKPTLTTTMEYFYLYQICYKLLGGFTKLTFCCLYLRIFRQKSFHILVIAVASVVAIGSLAFTIGTIFQCAPVHRAWDRTIPGHCISNTRFWYSHAAFNTFFDIVIYIMPIPIIKSLKLAHGQKMGLISIFCLGAFVIAASIVRMIMLRSSAHTTDPTWGSMPALIWTEIEANTSVICCCLPALRAPFLNMWRRMRMGMGSPASTAEDQITPQRQAARLGPNQGQAAVSHGLSFPKRSHQSSISKGTLGTSRNKTENSYSTESRSGDTWYNRVMSSLSREKTEISRYSSEIERSNGGIRTEPAFHLGSITKTTDLHVSMQDLPHELEGRPVSSYRTLDER